MKKVNSRLFCMVIALIMIFSSSVFAYDTSNNPVPLSADTNAIQIPENTATAYYNNLPVE